MSPDVLLLSLGTTLGWRVARRRCSSTSCAEAGACASSAVSVRIGATGRLRRAYPVTDIVEALAARRALRGRARARTGRARW